MSCYREDCKNILSLIGRLILVVNFMLMIIFSRPFDMMYFRHSVVEAYNETWDLKSLNKCFGIECANVLCNSEFPEHKTKVIYIPEHELRTCDNTCNYLDLSWITISALSIFFACEVTLAILYLSCRYKEYQRDMEINSNSVGLIARGIEYTRYTNILIPISASISIICWISLLTTQVHKPEIIIAIISLSLLLFIEHGLRIKTDDKINRISIIISMIVYGMFIIIICIVLSYNLSFDFSTIRQQMHIVVNATGEPVQIDTCTNAWDCAVKLCNEGILPGNNNITVYQHWFNHTAPKDCNVDKIMISTGMIIMMSCIFTTIILLAIFINNDRPSPTYSGSVVFSIISIFLIFSMVVYTSLHFDSHLCYYYIYLFVCYTSIINMSINYICYHIHK
jgi:hypothetical protein